MTSRKDIRYTHTQFLKPFVDSCTDLIEHNKLRLTWVKGYWNPPWVIERQYAACCKHHNNTVTITILLLETQSQQPMMLNLILENLAHELAHIIHWEHTIEHWELTTKILKRFSRVLRSLGIKDTNRRIKRLRY